MELERWWEVLELVLVFISSHDWIIYQISHVLHIFSLIAQILPVSIDFFYLCSNKIITSIPPDHLLRMHIDLIFYLLLSWPWWVNHSNIIRNTTWDHPPLIYLLDSIIFNIFSLIICAHLFRITSTQWACSFWSLCLIDLASHWYFNHCHLFVIVIISCWQAKEAELHCEMRIHERNNLSNRVSHSFLS